MRRLVFAFAVLFVFMNFHCNHDDQAESTPCTAEARPGLSITVLDAQTEQVLFDGVTVTATEGMYVETLAAHPGSTVFLGAWERRGTYTVSVVKDGYVPYTSEPIRVTSDICHVTTQNRTIRLIAQ